MCRPADPGHRFAAGPRAARLGREHHVLRPHGPGCSFCARCGRCAVSAVSLERYPCGAAARWPTRVELAVRAGCFTRAWPPPGGAGRREALAARALAEGAFCCERREVSAQGRVSVGQCGVRLGAVRGRSAAAAGGHPGPMADWGLVRGRLGANSGRFAAHLGSILGRPGAHFGVNFGVLGRFSIEPVATWVGRSVDNHVHDATRSSFRSNELPFHARGRTKLLDRHRPKFGRTRPTILQMVCRSARMSPACEARPR